METGAMSEAVAAAPSTTVVTYTPRSSVSNCLNMGVKQTLSRNPKRTCTPVWGTRVSWRISFQRRSTRSRGVSGPSCASAPGLGRGCARSRRCPPSPTRPAAPSSPWRPPCPRPTVCLARTLSCNAPTADRVDNVLHTVVPVHTGYDRRARDYVARRSAESLLEKGHRPLPETVGGRQAHAASTRHDPTLEPLDEAQEVQ